VVHFSICVCDFKLFSTAATTIIWSYANNSRVCVTVVTFPQIRRGADKSLAFPIFLFAAQPKEFFFDGLKKLEQRSNKCVELRGNM
jgi:hypothetical protein